MSGYSSLLDSSNVDVNADCDDANVSGTGNYIKRPKRLLYEILNEPSRKVPRFGSTASALLIIDNVNANDVYEWFSKLPIQWQSDRIMVVAAARKHGSILRLVPPTSGLLADRNVAVAALTSSRQCGLSNDLDYFDSLTSNPFRFLSPHLRADSELALLAARWNGHFWSRCSDEIKQTRRDVALAAVAKDGRVLREMPEIWKRDRDIVMAAIQTGRLGGRDWAEIIPEQLREERAIALEATKHCFHFHDHILNYISDGCKMDLEIVMEAVRAFPPALMFVLPQVMDFELVKAAIGQTGYYGCTLKFAPQKLRNDPDLLVLASKHVINPGDVWTSNWHGLRQRLRALNETLGEDESVLEDLFQAVSPAQFSALKETWILEKLESIWLVSQIMATEDGTAPLLNRDVCELVCQFAGLQKVVSKLSELQKMAPLIWELRRSYSVDEFKSFLTGAGNS